MDRAKRTHSLSPRGPRSCLHIHLERFDSRPSEVLGRRPPSTSCAPTNDRRRCLFTSSDTETISKSACAVCGAVAIDAGMLVAVRFMTRSARQSARTPMRLRHAAAAQNQRSLCHHSTSVRASPRQSGFSGQDHSPAAARRMIQTSRHARTKPAIGTGLNPPAITQVSKTCASSRSGINPR